MEVEMKDVNGKRLRFENVVDFEVVDASCLTEPRAPRDDGET